MALDLNRSMVRRYYEEMWNRWDFALADSLIDEAIEFRGSLGISLRGRSQFKDYMRRVQSAFPDFHNDIDELIGEADKVVARLTYTGTHRGELFQIAPTHRQITYAGAAFFQIDQGRIVQIWVLGDVHNLMQQLQGEVK